MKLRKLSIRRMPGFEERGFELVGLSDQLNVITGPNASGKTTACRSIQGLLWPETLSGVAPVSLAGDWEENGKSLVVDLEGANSTWQCDGVPSEMPPLPGVHVASCFTVTIDDLFSGSKTDVGLAERVAREMAGGYDLKSVRNLELFRLSRTHGRKELQGLEAAKVAVGRITTEQTALRAEEDQLAKFEEEEKEARTAHSRLTTLQDAKDLIDVRSQISEAKHILGEFPEGMYLLHGDESQRLQQVRTDLNAADQDLQTASDAAAEATQLRAAAQLPDAGISDLLLEEQKTRLENLRKTEEDMSIAKRSVSEADEKVRSAMRTLGESSESDKLDAIDLHGLDRINEYHRTAENIASRKSALEEKLALLGDEVPLQNTEALVDGIRILRQWFEAGPTESRASRAQLILTWSLIGLTVLTAAALTLFISSWWALLLLPAGMAAVAAWFLGKPASAGMRITLQEQYARLGLDQPDSWDRETVGKHLNALERVLAETRAAERDNSRRTDTKGQLERLKKEDDSIEQRRNALIYEFGISPDTSPLSLTVFAANLLQYRDAKTMRDVAHKQVTALEKEHDRQLQPINTYLVEYGEEQCDTYDIARVRSNNIEKRAAQYHQATVQLATAQKSLDSVKKRRAELERRSQQLFVEIGLLDNDEQGLRERLTLLSDYSEAKDKLKNLQARETALLSRLEPMPGILNLTIEQVNAETDRLQRIAKNQDDLYKKVLDIRTRIDSTARGSRLEDASIELEQRKDALAERQNEAMFAAAGNLLLDQVEAEYELESRPAVFLLASEWLSKFTRGRYELRLGGATESEPPAFRAFDTVGNRGLTIDELSRGTRIQLLLAVRLAFASKAERGTKLPFILDEVLSSSDPMRFRAIAECVLAMVGDGRQVLYFTCQPSDAIAWQEIAEKTGITDARMIDLTDVRSGERVEATLLAKSAAERKKVPDPGNMSVSEYVNALGVRALDPTAGARAAHIAHFVEDAKTLYQLLSGGIERFGQLESLVSFGAADAYVEENALSKMRVQACVLDAFAEAWRIGRGKPVSRDTLVAAGVSDSFIDRLTDLARDLNWGAKRLTQALQAREDERTKGFRSDALEKVTENLTESGHLDPRHPLSEEEVLTRVLAASNDYVKQGIVEAGVVRELCARFWRLSIAKIAGVPLDNVNAESPLNEDD
jgi:exonuclease SbcC